MSSTDHPNTATRADRPNTAARADRPDDVGRSAPAGRSPHTPEHRGSGRTTRLVLVLGLLALIAVFAVRFASIGRTDVPPSIASVQAERGKPVEAVTVEAADLETWVTVAGTVEGIVQYPIVSNNSLRIAGLPVREGDPVKAGDVIVRLVREAPNPMVHSYQKARAAYDNALKDVRRLRALFEAGAISEQALDQAETRLEVARVDLEDAEGSTSLTAGQDGLVSRVLIEEGETASAGKPLVWITRTDSVKIVFEVGSRQAVALREGQRAQWIAEGTGRSGEGRVARLDLMADPQTHLLEGEALFPNPDGALVPGLLMSVRILTGHREQVPTLPRECLLTSGTQASVYAIETTGTGDTIARRTAIETGLWTSDCVEVAGGLPPGALVVRYGQSKLEDGEKVYVVNAATSAAVSAHDTSTSPRTSPSGSPSTSRSGSPSTSQGETR